MKLAGVLRLLVPGWLALVAAGSVFAAQPDESPSETTTLFDPVDFIARMPSGTQVAALTSGALSRDERAAAIAEVEEVLRSWGEPPPVRAVRLPDDAESPRIAKRTAPRYPTLLRKNNIPGQARFLVLIGTTGEVLGVHCFFATHREFAESGAEALASWKFQPARIGTSRVPVIVRHPLRFDVAE